MLNWTFEDKRAELNLMFYKLTLSIIMVLARGPLSFRTTLNSSNYQSDIQISPVHAVVVSTVISGILFARFSTVECISTISSFLL